MNPEEQKQFIKIHKRNLLSKGKPIFIIPNQPSENQFKDYLNCLKQKAKRDSSETKKQNQLDKLERKKILSHEKREGQSSYYYNKNNQILSLKQLIMLAQISNKTKQREQRAQNRYVSLNRKYNRCSKMEVFNRNQSISQFRKSGYSKPKSSRASLHIFDNMRILSRSQTRFSNYI